MPLDIIRDPVTGKQFSRDTSVPGSTYAPYTPPAQTQQTQQTQPTQTTGTTTAPPAGTPPSGIMGINPPAGAGSMFANFLQTAVDRLSINNDAMKQKNLLIKAIYDSPLSQDELSQLPENVRSQVQGYNPQSPDPAMKSNLEMQLRLTNDSIAGRTGTLNQSIQFLSGEYDKSVTAMQKQKEDAVQMVQNAITQYGSAAFSNITPEARRQIEQTAGLPTGYLDRLPQTISQQRYGAGAGGVGNQTFAQALIDGSIPPSLISAYGGARNKAISEALKLDPNYNPAKAELKYQSAKKWVSAMNSTQMVRYQGLAGSVVNTINEVSSLADEMALSGITGLNAAELLVLVNTQGNTPKGQLASRYLAAVNTLKEEFANLANGGYAPTDAAWHLANSQINANYGVDQLKSSLLEVQRLINYRLNAIGDVQPVTMGGGEFGAPKTSGTTTTQGGSYDDYLKSIGQ